MGQQRSPLGVVDLELLASRGWRGVEEQELGDWLLRAGHGFTGRANSALVVGDPGLPLGDAVSAVARWYDERGLQPRAMLPGVQARPADAAFAAAGWVRDEAVLVLTAPVVPPGPPSVPVELLPAPDEGWLRLYGLARGALPPGALDVLTSGDDVVFAVVRTDGPDPAPPAAVARGVLTDGWLGVSALTVAEGHRRRGIATAVMAALTRWAADRGAHSVYLQVTVGNTAARALYRQAGFIEHHRYHYRRRA